MKTCMTNIIGTAGLVAVFYAAATDERWPIWFAAFLGLIVLVIVLTDECRDLSR